MKRYEVRGWYRFGDNEKDFEYADIVAENEQDVITMFRHLYKDIRFFSIDIKLVN